jgi:hypothetical protein
VIHLHAMLSHQLFHALVAARSAAEEGKFDVVRICPRGCACERAVGGTLGALSPAWLAGLTVSGEHPVGSGQTPQQEAHMSKTRTPGSAYE